MDEGFVEAINQTQHDNLFTDYDTFRNPGILLPSPTWWPSIRDWPPPPPPLLSISNTPEYYVVQPKKFSRTKFPRQKVPNYMPTVVKKF